MDKLTPKSQALYDELVTKFPGCDSLWRYFASLVAVPRPSEFMAPAIEWAKAQGLALGGHVKVDATGNVCISFPATKGMEGKPGVVLQAHLDMVKTNAAEKQHDWQTDPIDAYIEGDLLRARGTTLGADDGSGVAAALAVAACSTLSRGPLDVLLTTDEEVGLVGANGLKEGELLSAGAKYLVNVDSEEWGYITLSCAGGIDRELSIPIERSALPSGWQRLVLRLKDFRGGHTGADIHVGRANAIKWATAMLLENREAATGTQFRIASFLGGNAHNAIPSHADVEFAVPADKAAVFASAMSDVFHSLSVRFSHSEKGALGSFKEPKFDVSPASDSEVPQYLTFSSTRSVLRFAEALHHGVWRWNESMDDLVETSQSLSVVHVGRTDTRAVLEVFARSSNNRTLKALPKMLEALAELYDGTCKLKGSDYPGWPVVRDSRLCHTAVAVLKEKFEIEAKVISIHAGLECGIILNKFPALGLEAISVGPTVRHPHTVDEEMDIPSAKMLYHFLVHLLEALSK